FFFSSRRRHTRFSRDWSSDVCSSDLARGQRRAVVVVEALAGGGEDLDAGERRLRERLGARGGELGGGGAATVVAGHGALERGARSEERRVGKESRCRGAPHECSNETE